MKIADIYVRVSTDEQADKGYSQRDQEERLKKYCHVNSIQIGRIIFEDHSAKTFKRPEWSKYLTDIKKHRSNADFILFTKWDRFSRNAGDAYHMISVLRKYGIEPQAVEQPLDLSIPENKMMLAFYLAAPEVENDRRALNVIYGMRRARKEGRWMATAPLGYANRINEDGKKCIVAKEPQASIIKWAFKEILNGTLAADQIRKEANKKGLKCSRSNFWNLVRNPVYCGKIFVPKYKDDEARIVQGLHEPLITESLYYEVQEMLESNKRKVRPNSKVTSHENLPLRGFLVCPKCGRTLTGSASKGKYSLYYYYHCVSSCGFRSRADFAEREVVKEIRKYKPHPAMVKLYGTILSQSCQKYMSQEQNGTKEILHEIDKVNARLSKARELLLSDGIDAIEYKEIKMECEKKLAKLEANLSDTASSINSRSQVDKLINNALKALSQIDVMFEDADVVKRREIVSSIFQEKICFDGMQYRTLSVNPVAEAIFLINNKLYSLKNRKDDDFSCLSGWVVPTRIELVSKV